MSRASDARARLPVPMSALRVWLVEDNSLLRRTVAEVLARTQGLSCPLAVSSCEEALAAIDEGQVPDVVLMDIGLPGMSGIEGARRMRTLVPTARILMLTVHEEDEKVFAAVCAGASGYLLKPSSPERIVEALLEVGRGAAPMNAYIAKKVLDMFARLAPVVPAPEPYHLTPREHEILQLVVEGLTMREIAARLQVSYHTVDSHLRHIYEKLHVRSKSAAVAKAVREQLL